MANLLSGCDPIASTAYGMEEECQGSIRGFSIFFVEGELLVSSALEVTAHIKPVSVRECPVFRVRVYGSMLS
jgi:hypothetical protein